MFTGGTVWILTHGRLAHFVGGLVFPSVVSTPMCFRRGALGEGQRQRQRLLRRAGGPRGARGHGGVHLRVRGRGPWLGGPGSCKELGMRGMGKR